MGMTSGTFGWSITKGSITCRSASRGSGRRMRNRPDPNSRSFASNSITGISENTLAACFLSQRLGNTTFAYRMSWSAKRWHDQPLVIANLSN